MSYDHNFLTGLRIVPEKIEEPTTVPADTYDALLHAYQHLEAETRPVYRKAREMEAWRDIWCYIAVGALVALAIIWAGEATR